MTKISENLEKILDVSVEKDPSIIDSFKKLAKDNDVFLSIIAPYVGVKITPSKQISASIGLSEEFGVESVIEEIKECSPNCETLYLLINSPGGLVQSSYKVARALRKNFKNIVVFVPHIAASGGTLIALIGNEIVMGMMSQLTPLDPQSDKSSALNVVRGFENVTDFFRKMPVSDAPYSYKVLADKYDAERLDSAIASLELMSKYVTEILKEAKYKDDEIEKIAYTLVQGCITHGDVINLDQAKEIGLKAVEYTKYQQFWEIYRQWLGKYVLQSADKHIIRYWIKENKNQKRKELQSKDSKSKERPKKVITQLKEVEKK